MSRRVFYIFKRTVDGIKTLSVRKYDVNFIELASVTNFRVSGGIGRKLGIELGPLAC